MNDFIRPIVVGTTVGVGTVVLLAGLRWSWSRAFGYLKRRFHRDKFAEYYAETVSAE